MKIEASNVNRIDSEIERLLAQSPHGLGFTILRRRVGVSTRIHKVTMALVRLVDEAKVTLNHGTIWAHKPESISIQSPPKRITDSPSVSVDGPPIFGDPSFIGPVWEPAFALRLWQKGLRVIQQYPAEGFYLDIALISNDGRARLDIEVDGRTTHCDRFGRRKVGDIIRDSRLVAAGWSTKRFWVAELMRDMDGCVIQVEVLWDQLTGRGQ